MKTKILIYVLYVATLVVMAAATIVEKYHGTDYAAAHVYGSWWFTALWAVLAAASVWYFLKRKVRRFSVVALHLSFVVILLGALLTHLTAERGMIKLRKGVTQTQYFVRSSTGKITPKELPFALRLTDFKVVYHDGTTAEQDYKSQLTILDGQEKHDATVSMNNILSYRAYRFYQSSYDNDMLGSVLAINSDPFGIPVTYCGYALLFFSLVWMLVARRGPYRELLRKAARNRGVFILLVAVSLAFGGSLRASALNVLPKETADKFGRLSILYNGRICPLQTYAQDFTRKLCGSSSYNGYTAEQVLTGFIFWGDEWSQEPLLKIKSGELKSTLQLPDYVSLNTFFNDDMGGYILGPYVEEFYAGNNDKFHQQVNEIDGRLMLVMELRRAKTLKVFPYTYKGTTTWYTPIDMYPKYVEPERQKYMQNVFSIMYENALMQNFSSVDEVLVKMKKYQSLYGGSSIPSPFREKAERVYNAVPFSTVLFILNLTMGFLSLFLVIYRLTRRGGVEKRLLSRRVTDGTAIGVMLVSFLALTFCEALRWIISGNIPMGNGYETMLFVAWVVMLLSLAVCRRFSIVLTFGFLMSGFFLLVSHIGSMDPAIGNLMPVLNSPLLSAHVSVIMTGFAMLSITFICGLVALVLRMLPGGRAGEALERLDALRTLSLIFLYPALAFLGIGIFIGAIWANVSWGAYWSWDAKEVWALITFMVYGVAVHSVSLPRLSRPVFFHVYMVLAFLCILMTYFGVNYFLGGMHSYA